MRTKTLIEQAEERARPYSKPPKYEPTTAGMAGLVIGGLALTVFMGFAGIDSEAVAIPLLVTCALAFGVPFFIYRADEKRHHTNVIREYERLRKEENADRT